MVVLFQAQVDTQKLEEIFGCQPTVSISSCIGDMSFDKGKMVVITGTFLAISGGNKEYTISPSEFSKTINSSEIKGHGSFEGPWDEVGKKLVNLFFANHSEGSTIYLNGEKRKLLKKESSIDLV